MIVALIHTCVTIYETVHQKESILVYEKLTLVKKSPALQALERSIPGLERSTGEGIGNLLQYSWASLVTQLIKNPPALCQTWVRFLGCVDPLEEGNATHSSILAWRIPWTI